MRVFARKPVKQAARLASYCRAHSRHCSATFSSLQCDILVIAALDTAIYLCRANQIIGSSPIMTQAPNIITRAHDNDTHFPSENIILSRPPSLSKTERSEVTFPIGISRKPCGLLTEFSCENSRH